MIIKEISMSSLKMKHSNVSTALHKIDCFIDSFEKLTIVMAENYTICCVTATEAAYYYHWSYQMSLFSFTYIKR